MWRCPEVSQMFVFLGHVRAPGRRGKLCWNSKGHHWTKIVKIAHMLRKTKVQKFENLVKKFSWEQCFIPELKRKGKENTVWRNGKECHQEKESALRTASSLKLKIINNFQPKCGTLSSLTWFPWVICYIFLPALSWYAFKLRWIITVNDLLRYFVFRRILFPAHLTELHCFICIFSQAKSLGFAPMILQLYSLILGILFTLLGCYSSRRCVVAPWATHAPWFGLWSPHSPLPVGQPALLAPRQASQPHMAPVEGSGAQRALVYGGEEGAGHARTAHGSVNRARGFSK